MSRGFVERHRHPEYAPGQKDLFKAFGGNFILNNTSWTPFYQPTSNLFVAAKVGDWVKVEASGIWNNEGIFGFLDAQSIISGSPVNPWGTTKTGIDLGIMGWLGQPSVSSSITGGVIKQIVSGDIDTNGNVTIGLYYRTSSAGNKTLFAAVGFPFTWWIENRGP